MPIYEYRCPKCGDFDQMQKITEQPLKKCPTCKAKVTKLLSNPAFHLKGAGWYITDYGRKGADGKSSDGKSADGKSSDSGASESKSADSSGSDDSKSEKKAEKKEKKADKKPSSASAAA